MAACRNLWFFVALECLEMDHWREVWDNNLLLQISATSRRLLWFSQLMISSLREKCPGMEFFLVRIFPHSDWIRENTDQKNLRIWTLSTQCVSSASIRQFMYVNLWKIVFIMESNVFVIPSYHLLVQIKKWKQQNNLWNLFKTCNRNNRMTSAGLKCMRKSIFLV